MKESRKDKQEYMEERLLSFIPEGKFNAVSCSYLSSMMGCAKRKVIRLVQEMREKGIPICSTTCDGYWMPKDDGDIIRTIKALEVRRNTLNETIDTLTRILL